MYDPNKRVVVQIAPAVRVAIGEEFGFEPGENTLGKTVAALRRLGFDQVFDTSVGADLDDYGRSSVNWWRSWRSGDQQHAALYVLLSRLGSLCRDKASGADALYFYLQVPHADAGSGSEDLLRANGQEGA